MTSARVTAVFCIGVASLLLSASMCEAYGCLKGKSTFLFKPKPTGQTTHLLEDCRLAATAYNCIEPLAMTYDPEADFVDFDSFARKYVSCVLNEEYARGMNLSFISPMYPGFYVQMSMKNMEYKEPTKITNSLPEVLLVKKFHNQQVSDYVKSEVMQSVERTQTTANTVGKGFSTSASMEAGIKTPFVEASVKAEVNFNLDSSSTQTETYTRTFSLTDTILVPPNSTVKLVWSISQNEMNLPWTGELQISGYIPTKRAGDDSYSFLPVGHMAAFFPDFFKFESSTSMVYSTHGNFRGVTAVDSNIDVVEMPLHADKKCPPQS